MWEGSEGRALCDRGALAIPKSHWPAGWRPEKELQAAKVHCQEQEAPVGCRQEVIIYMTCRIDWQLQ